MFIGQFLRNVDSMSRVKIPPQFLDELGFSCYVVAAEGPCLVIFSEATWSVLLNLAKDRGKRSYDRFMRNMVSRAQRMEIDKQGRIPIPASHRVGILESASLLIVGMADWIEIWMPETYTDASVRPDITQYFAESDGTGRMESADFAMQSASASPRVAGGGSAMPEDSWPRQCATPGCFNTPEGGEYCADCLSGRTPDKRGEVTWREVMYARLLGDQDAAVIRERMIRHGQPVDILVRRSLPSKAYAEVARRAQLDLQKVVRRVAPQKIFISYAKEDFHRAEELYSAFSARGHVPWMDKKNLLAGQRWKLEISRAMTAADFCVVCLSRFSVNKTGYCQKEIRLALEQLDLRPEGHIYAVPVRYDDCEIPDSLKDLHVLDMTSRDALGQLLQAIEVAAESKV